MIRLHSLAALALVGCAGANVEPASQQAGLLPTELAAAPGAGGLGLSVLGDLTPGDPVVIIVTGAKPGQTVFVGASTSAAANAFCPAALAPLCMSIPAPNLLGSGPADANGQFAVTVPAPPSSPGTTWYFQAAAAGAVAVRATSDVVAGQNPAVDGGATVVFSTNTVISTNADVDAPWYVPAGVTLTINPGVQLDFGINGGIWVEGSLVADGTNVNPVRFVSASFTNAVDGVNLDSDTDLSVFDNVVFSGVSGWLNGDAAPQMTNVVFDAGPDGDGFSTLTVLNRTTGFDLTNITFDGGPAYNSRLVDVRGVPMLNVNGGSFDDGSFAIRFEPIAAGTLTVSNCSFARVTSAVQMGFFSQAGHSASLTDLFVSQTDGRALYFSGTAVTVDTVSVLGSNLQSFGATSASSSITGNDLLLDGSGSNCLESSGPVNLIDSSVDTCAGSGIRSDGDLTLTNTMIANTIGNGATTLGNGTLTNVDVSNAEGDGVFIRRVASIDGLFVDGVTEDCLDINGTTASIANSTFENCGNDGVEATESASVITNVLVSGASTNGLSTGTTTVSGCTINTVGGEGINVSRAGTSSVTLCDVSAANRGIRSANTTFDLDVSFSNVTNNASTGIENARLIDNTYVAFNAGQIIVDATVGGTVDGAHTTQSATTPRQILAADAVSSPAASAVPGTGYVP